MPVQGTTSRLLCCSCSHRLGRWSACTASSAPRRRAPTQPLSTPLTASNFRYSHLRPPWRPTPFYTLLLPGLLIRPRSGPLPLKLPLWIRVRHIPQRRPHTHVGGPHYQLGEARLRVIRLLRNEVHAVRRHSCARRQARRLWVGEAHGPREIHGHLDEKTRRGAKLGRLPLVVDGGDERLGRLELLLQDQVGSGSISG